MKVDLSREEILHKIKTIIKESMCFRNKKGFDLINEDSELEGDLGCDSLDVLDLIFQIEYEFDINMDNEDFYKLKKIKDLIDCIEIIEINS